jgi:hypothetical protein
MNIQRYNIKSLLRDRADAGGYHVASEDHVRIEFVNLRKGGCWGPVVYDGNLVVTCYSGELRAAVDGTVTRLIELDQVVLEPGRCCDVSCESDTATLQVIWAPSFAKTVQPEQGSPSNVTVQPPCREGRAAAEGGAQVI